MGATAKDFLEEREKDCYINLEMSIAHYEKNQELFSGEEIRIKSAYRKTERPKSDKKYKDLLDTFLEAKNNLTEYEVEMNYKTQINY